MIKYWGLGVSMIISQRNRLSREAMKTVTENNQNSYHFTHGQNDSNSKGFGPSLSTRVGENGLQMSLYVPFNLNFSAVEKSFSFLATTFSIQRKQYQQFKTFSPLYFFGHCIVIIRDSCLVAMGYSHCNNFQKICTILDA